jgi:hypothetical protein
MYYWIPRGVSTQFCHWAGYVLTSEVAIESIPESVIGN